MCRWIAYIGKPITMDTLITKPTRSLIDQSLNSRQSFKPDGTVLPTNGDGFGMGWYNDRPEPGIFKVPDPAWNNENINELCASIQSPLFMAHIRAASTGSIQRTNAHPFKYKNWLFQHNGYINHFDLLKRDLHFALAPELYPCLRGTTDSETFFLLAITHGLAENPKMALEKTVAHIGHLYAAKGISAEMVLSCALSDGKSLYTLRYSSHDKVHSQYYSTHAECLKEIGDDGETMPRKSVAVVSEPLDQSSEYWEEMPPNSFATIRSGQVNIETLKVT